ncbi:MAG: glycosyltransferase family 2 protein [Bacilli bacterium]|nr:glycosyltransferase family 2 protein [Bacilli bacterium]
MGKASKKSPLISIIIPVYKVEEFLDRCVKSVTKQTYKHLEIILVDDGSPDNCPKMCDDWAKKDKRIRVIHKKNGGLSDARNAGIRVAKGDYIGFIDSDDWIDKKMYEVLYKNIVKYDADISCCELYKGSSNPTEKELKEYDNKVKTYNQEEYMKIFFKIGTQQCVYYAVTKLYRRELLEDNLYPVGLTSEDVVGTCKVLFKCNKIVSVNYPYYIYYKNDKSITGSKFSNNDFHLLEIWDKVVDLCKDTEYEDMATLNRERIDYTLLMRMAVQLSNKEINEKYGDYKKELLERLKKNKKRLLKSPIPTSRKITLRLLLLNYRLFVSTCKLYLKR